MRLLGHGCEDAAVFSFLQTLQRSLQGQGSPPSSSSHRGDEASPVLHNVLEQRQRRSGEPQPWLPDLFLHQGQAVLQTPAGQQHQRSGRHLLSRTKDCRGRQQTPLHVPPGLRS
ncbi:hypothetical protein ATANTOWER_003670 [Ataeniobius toweri]|uniref:Uncharacterized protein n=1 Tax=Ataeniobius toweri TaxID=208326 RepID=A0ABU7BZN7_9TELE|nr:hypothetical protein [Ataeniobius toweri]